VTEQNRAHAVAEEKRRANDALRAADLLVANELYSDAISRLYYCVLARVRALLLTLDLETRSHEAALRLLSLHFVKAGTLPRETAHVFAKLMKFREEAAYNASYLFTAEDFDELRIEALRLAQATEALIRAAGYCVRVRATEEPGAV